MKTFTFNVLLLLCTLSGLTFADTFKFKSDPYPPYIIADQYNNFLEEPLKEILYQYFKPSRLPLVYK